MLQRWWRIIGAALLMLVPLVAGPAIGEEHAPAAAVNAAKRPPKTKAAKSTAKPAPRKSRSLRPSDMAASHRPPASMPTPVHSRFEVPQAKNLADTPNVVLNSKVRASLISALPGAAGQDIMSDTSKGVVTLTGTVKTKQLRARAEQVAQKVHGVRAVKNRLVIK